MSLEQKFDPSSVPVKLLLFSIIFIFFGIVACIILYLAAGNGGIIQPPQVSILPSPSFKPVSAPIVSVVPEIQDETKDWKTYNNPEAIFSFKYPANWSIQNESESTVTIGSGNDNTVIVGVLQGSPNTSLEDNFSFVKNILDKNGYSYREVNNKKISGAKILLDLSSMESVTQAYLVGDKEIIAVVYTYYKYPETTQVEKEKFLLERFLPTFILN